MALIDDTEDTELRLVVQADWENDLHLELYLLLKRTWPGVLPLWMRPVFFR